MGQTRANPSDVAQLRGQSTFRRIAVLKDQPHHSATENYIVHEAAPRQKDSPVFDPSLAFLESWLPVIFERVAGRFVSWPRLATSWRQYMMRRLQSSQSIL
jgi:hypothetical protein